MIEKVIIDKILKYASIVFATIIIFVGLVGCSKEQKETVDINNYVLEELIGYNNYASVLFSIDYDSLVNEFVKDESVANDLIDVAKKFEPFIASHSESNTLKNGDLVKVKWKENKEAVSFLEKMLNKKIISNNYYEYKVKGLEEPILYNAFSELVIDTKASFDGVGTIDTYIDVTYDKCESIKIGVIHNGKNGSLKNGDIIKLSIDKDFDLIEFTKQTGLLIEQTTYDYKINCLCKELSETKELDRIDEKTKNNIDTAFNEWVVAGLNDESVFSKKRTYSVLGYMYYSNKNNRDGMLLALYKVKSPFMSEPYYTFMGIKGCITLDHEYFYSDGNEISNSFMDYEKEKVRYETDIGWIVGGEENGFLVDEEPFAGHQNFNNMLNYIRSVYGANYKKEIIDQDLQRYIEVNQ